MNTVWIVAANRTDARIFESRRGENIEELATFICSEARQPDRASLTDAPGRSHDRLGTARHSMEPHTGLADQLAQRFARQIAGRVERGRTDNAWDELVLVAGPEFLGHLREALGSHCMQHVIAECHKNIVTEDIPAIVAALPEQLQHRLQSRAE
jgi:protein required for attachment to host cells